MWTPEKERYIYAYFPLEGPSERLEQLTGCSKKAIIAKAKRMDVIPPLGFFLPNKHCSKRGCALTRSPYSTYCEYHSAAIACKTNFNTNNPEFVYEAINKFKAQGSKCSITGVPIYLGYNASTDHVIPVCKGGSNDISNLEWVSITANYCKQSLSKDSFIFLCLDATCKAMQEERYKAYIISKAELGEKIWKDLSS